MCVWNIKREGFVFSANLFIYGHPVGTRAEKKIGYRQRNDVEEEEGGRVFKFI